MIRRVLLWPFIFVALVATVLTACVAREQFPVERITPLEEALEGVHADPLPTPAVSRLAAVAFERYAPLELLETQEAEVIGEVYVLRRVDDLTAFPCSTCHVRPLAELRAESVQQGRLQHWDIQLDHADSSTMTCATCHNLEESVDTLRTLTGVAVAFDASYQVCAQCHAGQFQDWLGGAHGKQIGGWAPPRIMAGCADCHNPHQPQWDVRWPAIPPHNVQRNQEMEATHGSR